MRLRSLSCTLLVFFFCSTAALAASSPDERQITDPKSILSASNASARAVPLDDLYYTRTVFGAAWSPDGKQVSFTTDITGRSNLWKVNASGGWPIQLTQSDDRQFSATWSPDGKWIVYEQDKGGDELWDLYAVPSDGGEVINLTNTPAIREESPLWSFDGKTLALSYKPKESTVYDVALLDWSSRKVSKLTHEQTRNHSWNAVAWSPDGAKIYANRTEVTFTDSDIYSIDVATGKAENLTPHQGQIFQLATSLSRDGKTLLITSNQKGGYQNVALLDVATKNQAWVTDTKWEAQSGDFSRDGKSFSYVMNEDGRSEAYLVDRATQAAKKIDLAEGLNTFTGSSNAFSPGGDRLLVSHESSTQPPDLWVYDIASHHPAQLTYSAIASLANTPLPASQIVHYKTFDGKTISALMWVPFNLKRDNRNPALVLPHGGPTGQRVDYWSPEVASLTSRGYICIAPNVRGSTGYGLDFQKANYQDLGGGDLQDEVYAAKFLAATGYVDAKKIGITGGSYGPRKSAPVFPDAGVRPVAPTIAA